MLLTLGELHMLQFLINFIKRLFGLNKPNTKIKELEKEKEQKESQLERIENEQTPINDIVDEWNRK